MLPYLFIISLTVLCVFVAEKFYSRSRLFFWIASLFALIPPALMAAFRDFTVGVDIKVYQESCFIDCRHADSYLDALSSIDLDPVFVTINYLTSIFTNDMHYALFFIELVFLVVAYVAMFRLRACCPVWCMMLIFLFCFYNLSFNLMRQMIALAFLLLSVSYLHVDRSFTKFFLWLIVCGLCHKTAIIGGLFYFAVYFIVTRPEKYRFPLAIVFGVGCFMVAVIFKMILEWAAQISPVMEHYLAYGGDGSPNSFKPALLTILILGDFILLGFSFVISRYVAKGSSNPVADNTLILTLVLFVVADVMAQFLGLYTGFASRISCYFCGTYMFLIPSVVNISALSKKSAYLCKSVALLLFFIIWLRMLPMTGSTVPYTSNILGL